MHAFVLHLSGLFLGLLMVDLSVARMTLCLGQWTLLLAGMSRRLSLRFPPFKARSDNQEESIVPVLAS
jgi:hypothetical protein